MPDTPLKTALFNWHSSHGGRLVEFGGWSMPVQYTTIVQEHEAVRNHVGLFDISHMGRLAFVGQAALPWLERVTTNAVSRLALGQIQYSLMVNDQGGVIDDILVYRVAPEVYSVVCNASNREAVVAQFNAQKPAGAKISLEDATLETGMIALQGPKALTVLKRLCDAPLETMGYYYSRFTMVAGVPCNMSRTGYTGEDGFEIGFDDDQAENIWTALLTAGASENIVPCGLGARDTLRFEAAMPLYGHELSLDINPFAAGVGWAVKLHKSDFVGREALAAFKADPGSRRVGLALEGKRIGRQGATVLATDGTTKLGTVTSGTFSPTLGKSLAMAMIEPSHEAIGTPVLIDVRGHLEPAIVTQMPFYSRHKSSTEATTTS
jgi:aminomethyltransferase